EEIKEDVKDEFIDVDKMKSEIAEKNKRIDELEERLQKLYADYDNFRKRKEAEADSAKKYAAEKIVLELLPIVDNFERAVDASAKTKNYDSLKDGVVMIHRQIWEILGKVGLSAIDSIVNVFDPALHQAVFCEKKEDVDEDVIIAELLKGYKLHDRVIRPSMVIVNKK
ncbi:nucleotide exchange factor GrpE, partial [bacterium]|nr:nucleotide exchange factor GrpE [bacterium]